MRLYFDVCSLQRPLDDKVQLRVLVEADTILGLIALCEAGQIELVSSFALRYEIAKNPNPIHRDHCLGILRHATLSVELTEDIEQKAKSLELAGIKPMDALHVASAIAAGADYFCTCDDRLIKKARTLALGKPKVVGPLELVAEIEP